MINIEAKIALPFIHMNGTSANDLLEGYRAAMDAVQAARESLSKIEFNARDYYPVEGLWQKAVAEMRLRQEALANVEDELKEVALHCMNAIEEKKAREQERNQKY